MQGAAAFPVHELTTVVVIVGLIATLLYFFGGAWGAVLLWLLAMVFVLCWAGIPAVLFVEARQRIGRRQWGVAAASALGAALAAMAWLAAEGWLAHRAWTAIP